MTGEQCPNRSTPTSELDEANRLVLDALASPPVDAPAGPDSTALRDRLVRRLARSMRAASAFHTVRGEPLWLAAQSGLRWRWLYRAQSGRALRAGEPRRVRQIDVSGGVRGALALEPGLRCEWLVLRGDVCIDGVTLAVRDYHVAAARERVAVSSANGALLYLREANAAREDGLPHTVRDREAPWLPHAPGLERRVLWQRGREAALLYRVQAGVEVPRHGHGHDEECLMVEGEAFVDDILLGPGEYQLAPAGTSHEGVSCDTGGILFAHGDIDLAVLPR